MSTYERFYDVVRTIPRGRVTSYGVVAGMAGLPGHARQVGYALRNLPSGHNVPWHRVVQATGRIAFPPDSPPYRKQVERLLVEDVAVIGGRIDMQKYRWQPDLDELLWKPMLDRDEQ